MITGLPDESVWPTLARKDLRSSGTGAFACQPIFSQTLSKGTGMANVFGWLQDYSALEEIILHALNDAIRHLALATAPKASPHERPVPGLTGPDHCPVFHIQEANISLIFVLTTEHNVIPLVISFNRRPGTSRGLALLDTSAVQVEFNRCVGGVSRQDSGLACRRLTE